MQIVAVQLEIAWENKPHNRSRVEQLLDQSQIEADSLIVLPEMFETGFSMNLSATAQTEQRESEQFVRDLAKRHRSAVLAGIVSPAVESAAGACDTNPDSKTACNEAVVVSPDGDILARYQKMQPFTLSGEDRHYPAGSKHCVFEWQGTRIAPFVCYDLRFPELFRSALDDGAEMFVVIACWPAVRSEHWVRLLQARAIENLALVVGVNRCGSEPNLQFDGRSCAFDQLGKCLFEADGSEQVLTTQLDVEAMRKWREKFPALRDRRAL